MSFCCPAQNDIWICLPPFWTGVSDSLAPDSRLIEGKYVESLNVMGLENEREKGIRTLSRSFCIFFRLGCLLQTFEPLPLSFKIFFHLSEVRLSNLFPIASRTSSFSLLPSAILFGGRRRGGHEGEELVWTMRGGLGSSVSMVS